MPNDEPLTIVFETPTPYHTLDEWLAYREWLEANLHDEPYRTSYIRDADEQIAEKRARGEN